MSIAQRNLDAEARAVEEGHNAIVQPGGWVKVKSDTFEGKFYRVDFSAAFADDPIYFVCQPLGRKAFEEDHLVVSLEPGVVGCKHAARAARRLEREGLAQFDGERWRTTAKVLPPRCGHEYVNGVCQLCGDDAFAGF